MENQYLIYRTINTINGNEYVGQHKYKNINDGYMGSGFLLKRAFEKYGRENFIREIIASDLETKEEADEAEKLCIMVARHFLGDNSYNIADGGQGGNLGDEVNRRISESHKGMTLSEEHKMKISESMKGKHLSEEHKKKLSESMKGMTLSEEHKMKISESMKGRTFSEESRKKMSESKGVNGILQYSKDGTFLNEYYSLMEAERKTGCNNGHISEVCQGKLKSTGGYIWRYKELH